MEMFCSRHTFFCDHLQSCVELFSEFEYKMALVIIIIAIDI